MATHGQAQKISTEMTVVQPGMDMKGAGSHCPFQCAAQPVLLQLDSTPQCLDVPFAIPHINNPALVSQPY